MKMLCHKIVLLFVAAATLLLPWANQTVAYGQSADSCVEGPHSGIISSDQTWCARDTPHLLTADVMVNPGVTLTIEAGAAVQAAPSAGLKVQGLLSAIGTAEQPITFTHDGGGHWSGLLFNEGYGTLRWAQIDHATDAHEEFSEIGHILARNVQAGELVIEDSLLAEGQSGLDLTNSRVALRNTTLRNLNTGTRYPIYARGATSRLVMSGNTFENNATNRVWLGADALNGGDVTLPAQTGLDAYYFHDGYTVPAGVTLNLLAGVKTVTRSSDSYNTRAIVINGHLSAVGSEQQPVIFTSTADNGPSQWAGLNFTGGTGQLQYVTLRNIGQIYEGGYNVALLVKNTPAGGWVRFERSTLYNTTEDAIRIDNGRAQIIDSTIRDTSLGGDDYRNAVNILNANSVVEIRGNTFTNNSTAITMTDTQGVTITDNVIVDSHGWLGAVNAERSIVTITRNRIENSAQDAITLGFAGGTISDNILRGSGRSGVMLTNAYNNTPQTVLTNNVIVENAELGTQYAGVRVQASPARLNGTHNTIARNAGAGVYVSAGTVTMTNTILSRNTLGVQGGGSLTLNNTLFDGNTTDTTGRLTNNQPLTGPAAFASDGYHLTGASKAIGAGAATSVATDIDGEVRPAPAGSLPDLGADEYAQIPESELDTAMYALNPQWFAIPNPDSGVPSGMLRQRYVLRLTHAPSAAPAVATLTDTFPADLAFASEEHSPAMDVTRQGNQVRWQTQAPLQPGDVAAAWLTTEDSSPRPGQALVNTADISVGAFTQHFEVTTTVPVLPPLITFPGDGEICSTPDSSLTVKGGAQPGTTVILYEDGVEKGRAALPLDGSGAFEITYPDSRAGKQSTTLTAVACSIDNPGACSATSEAVELTESLSFWCPQRSHWVNATNFRSAGVYTTQRWGVNGGIGGKSSDFYLYACNCPGADLPPANLRVEADGATYLPAADSAPPLYHFAVNSTNRELSFIAECGVEEKRSSGVRLIDPDGYVFNVTQGFDPNSPTDHAIAGVKVTAYVEIPGWGGWVPWPAHLYENQQNPQTTGADGYFAFFTPPGRYYLQVDGIPGFQPWRSPVIEVVDEIVHVNVPYTPWPGETPVRVDLTAGGPQPATVSIPAGSVVEWAAEVPATDDDLLRYTDYPILRALSDLNPLENTQGWHSGMLAPASSYRRAFTTPGAYTYSDGAGHGGTIEVLPIATNEPPVLTLTQPSADVTLTQGETLTVQWSDSDADDNAAIALAYDPDRDPSNGNHTWVATALSEDPDGAGDQYAWNTGGVAPGTYSMWGKIDDGHNPAVYALAPAKVTITAPQPCYTLTTGASPAGSGTVGASPAPNCAGGKYTQGTSIQLQATASAGYVFANWSGSVAGTANPVTVTMTADQSVTANFTASSTCPTPRIKSIRPGWIRIRSTNVQMTLTGSGFMPNSVVRWNGVELKDVKYISSTKLQVGVPLYLLLRPGKASVTVTNPGPCMTMSQAMEVVVSESINIYIPMIRR